MDAMQGLRMLFDLSFSEFVTTRVIKVLYIIGMAFSAICPIALIVAGFILHPGYGVLFLLLSPVLFLLFLLFSRIGCEMIMVLFRIAENTSRLADQEK